MGISEKKTVGEIIRGVAVMGVFIALLCLVCAATYFAACFFAGDESKFTAVSNIEKRAELPVIVIDPGHGGIDGGAAAPDGGREKDMNLEVSERLYRMFRFLGIDCVMTRYEDKLLADESMKSNRKMTDLKNRLAVVNSIRESGREVIFVSIHMNNFSIPKYSGLQVWYSPNHGESQDLAKKVQQNAKLWLDTGNNREIKKADSSIYLLDRATVPAILVECGFLSNPEEYARLSTEEYRNKLAMIICAAICDMVGAK